MATNCEKIGVKVFELTMDNDEDQDELNRRLRKPGEPERRAFVKQAEPAISAPADKEINKKCQDLG